MCVDQVVCAIRCHCWTQSVPVYNGRGDATTITWFQCRVLVWLLNVRIYLIGIVMCVVIVLTEKGTDEIWERGAPNMNIALNDDMVGRLGEEYGVFVYAT